MKSRNRELYRFILEGATYAEAARKFDVSNSRVRVIVDAQFRQVIRAHKLTYDDIEMTDISAKCIYSARPKLLALLEGTD